MPLYLNTQDIARQLNVNVETVRRWLRTRELKGMAFGRAGYRVEEADFQDFLRRRHEAQGAAQAQLQEHTVRSALEEIEQASLLEAEQRQMQLQAALQREQETRAQAEAVNRQLAGVLAALPVAVLIVDKQGRTLQRNQFFEAVWGQDAPMLEQGIKQFHMYKGWSSATGRPLAAEEWAMARALQHGETSLEEEIDIETVSGERKTILHSAVPLRDETGTLVGGVATMLDITERRQLEQRTQQALEALLIMAEEMVQLPVSAADAAPPHPTSAVAQRLVELICRVLGCKRASITTIDPIAQAAQSVAVSGLSQEQTEGWQNRQAGFVLSECFSDPLLAVEFQEKGILVLDLRQPPWNTRLTIYGAQTVLLVSMQVGSRRIGILTLDYGEAAHIYSEREQTLARAVAELAALVLERERLLRERAEALAQEETLREANRRMDEFIGFASHELRTPLTTIKAALQLATRRLTSLTLFLDQSEKALAHLSGIQSILLRAEQQADRQRRLMNDLLDISRIQVGTLEFRMRACNVLPIVREVVESQQQTTPQRSIHLESVLEEAAVYADADRISQVVSNYLSNALKYSPAAAPITVSLEKHGSVVWIAVRDKGTGLSPEAQKHIWERFYRVPGAEVQGDSSGGLGLGLYICRMIVEAHHGLQGVESVEGAGSTFWFTLPLLAAAETAS